MVAAPIVILPTSLGMAKVRLGVRNAVAVAQSPRTYSQQVYRHAGAAWDLSAVLPPLDRTNAEEWVGALSQLNGRYGTFLFGDPSGATPRGAASVNTLAIPNRALFTEDFTQTWSPTAATIPSNTYLDPLGGLKANCLEEDGTTAQHYVLQNLTGLTSSVSFWISVYLKAMGRTWAMLLFSNRDGVSHFCNFDLVNGVTGTTSLGGGFISITNIGGGWYRCAILSATGAGGSTPYIQLLAASSDNVTSYAGASRRVAFRMFGANAIENAFLFPYVTSQGSSANVAGGLVNGASQTGSALAVQAFGTNVRDILKVGDYIELPNSRLHKLTETASADAASNGSSTFKIWPPLRESPADSAVIAVKNTRGIFRLTNDFDFNIEEAVKYGISFGAEEVV